MLLPAVGNAWAADPPEHLWSRAFIATPIDTTGSTLDIHRITLNSSGDVALVGRFHGSVDLGGGPLLAPQFDDVFVALFDATGNHVWSRAIAKGNTPRPSVVAIDAAGNLVVGGQFIGTLNLGGTPLVSNNFADAYLAKFGPDGAHLWSKRFGLSGAFGNLVEDMVIGTDGSIVIVGSLSGRMDFGGGVLQSAGGHDIFLAKLDSDGGHIWSRRFGGPGPQQGSLVAMDAAANVTIAGKFYETLDLGGGPFTADGEDGFVARFDSLASPVWSRWIVTSPAGPILNSIDVNGAGEIVLSGSFFGLIDFGGSALTGSGSFMTYFDATGSYRWHVHEPSLLYVTDAAFDELGYVLAAGSFEGTWDLGVDPIESVERDAFIARFDSDGEVDWARALGGSGDDGAGRLAAGPTADGLLLSGFCSEGIDFGGGGLEGNALFLAQLAPRPPEPVFSVSLFPQGRAIEVRWNVTTEQPLDTLTILRNLPLASPETVFTTEFASGTGSFMDHGVVGGRKYQYQLVVTTTEGAEYRSPVVTATATVPALASSLAQNAPNPFNPSTTIEYTMAKRSTVAIEIFDVAGARVRRIDQGVRDAGEYSVEWNGRDDAGTVVGTGVYFYRLDGVAGVAPRKMVLLK